MDKLGIHYLLGFICFYNMGTTSSVLDPQKNANKECLDGRGILRGSGEKWILEPMCEKCACEDGVITCNTTRPTDCPPPPHPTCIEIKTACCSSWNCSYLQLQEDHFQDNLQPHEEAMLQMLKNILPIKDANSFMKQVNSSTSADNVHITHANFLRSAERPFVGNSESTNVPEFDARVNWSAVMPLMNMDITKESTMALEEGFSSMMDIVRMDRLIAAENDSLASDSPSFKLQKGFSRTDPIALRSASLGHAMNKATKMIVSSMNISLLDTVALPILGEVPGCTKKFQSFQRPALSPSCKVNSKYRTIDGSCNNPNERLQGASFTKFRRVLPSEYGDGISSFRQSIRGTPLPSARLISSTINSKNNAASKTHTLLHVAFGQFIDHDLTSTPMSKGFQGRAIKCCNDGIFNFTVHEECAPISIPDDDPFYSCHGQTCMEFVRSSPAGSCTFGPREQLNQRTAYLDGSVIYGVKKEETDSLRLFQNGLLKFQITREGQQLLPVSNDLNDGCNIKERFNKNEFCFKAGDDRANEQILLTLVQTVWKREHNRVARLLKNLNPFWNDEKIFQETRRVVAAELQHVTYKEHLKTILGSFFTNILKLNPLEGDEGSLDYDENLDASIGNVFATAAYRFGHSEVADIIMRINKYGAASFEMLSSLFFSPFSMYEKDTVVDLARGGLAQSSAKVDIQFSEEISGKLFRGSQPFGLDLVALNIQRGRDHGLPGYVNWREHCGLGRIKDFKDLSSSMDDEVIEALKQVYSNVDDIDLFVGGMAERPQLGAIVGPTFACLIADQFMRIKQGDRYWYEYRDSPGAFKKEQLRELHRVSLARILCNNIPELEKIQPLPLEAPGPGNERVSCQSDSIPFYLLSPWKK